MLRGGHGLLPQAGGAGGRSRLPSAGLTAPTRGRTAHCCCPQHPAYLRPQLPHLSPSACPVGARTTAAASRSAHRSSIVARTAQVEAQHVDTKAAVPQEFKFHFTCPYETAFGERICLVGGLPEMGDWDLGKAIELKWHEGHEWKNDFSLPRSRSNFEYKVVVVSDHGSRWEEGNNRVVEFTPELLEAPLDVVIDFRLCFQNHEASQAHVLVDGEDVRAPLELSEARLRLQEATRSRMQEALSKMGGSGQAKGLEAELARVNEESASLQGKVDELRAAVGEQSLDSGATVWLATEAGRVSIPSILNRKLLPISREEYAQPDLVFKDFAVGEPTGLEMSIDPAALPLAANGNGAGLEPTASAAAMAAIEQQQQQEAEERVRMLEEMHRLQMEEVQALAAAEQREIEWQAQVQAQLQQAQARQAAHQQQRQIQQAQAAAQPLGGTTEGLEDLADWISTRYMGMGKSAMDALPELRRRGVMSMGRNMYSIPGQPGQLSADELALVLRLQPRTPSRPSTPPKRMAPTPVTVATPSLNAAADMEALADFISANYMGMGKSAADALPELRRAGVEVVGLQRYSLNGVVMSSPVEIAEALRLQPRTASQSVTPASSRPVSPSPTARAGPRSEVRGMSPPRASPMGSRSGSPSRAFDAELENLASYISEKYTGMGKSTADTLPELRRRGIMSCGWNLYSVPGQSEKLDAEGVARVLRLQVRPDSRSSSPSRSTSPIRAPASRIQPMDSGSTLEDLAGWIAANYSGLGKSAADTLPELRRKGVTASGNSFSMGGELMGPEDVAHSLRLQARTPSRPSTPTRAASPTASYSPPAPPVPKPSAPASDDTQALEDLAAWVSSNYMGMGKSAADALPELRRRQVTALGNNTYSVAGNVMDAAGIAQALRLMPRDPSRMTSPIVSRSSSPGPSLASSSLSAPSSAGSAGLPSGGLEGLAAWISTNYMGMGKSAADALPELRRAGVTASGNNYSLKGQLMGPAEIAQALRLQPRTASRPTTPVHTRPFPSPAPAASPSAPAAATPAAASSPSGSAGLEGLAAWISANYSGMGKSAADALPELRRAGVTASGSGFTLKGSPIDGPGLVQALRLQPRTPSRPTTPIPTRSPPSAAPAASPSAPAAPTPTATSPSSAGPGAGLEGLAAWISANYMGMGKSAADALPELRRAGVAASGSGFTMKGSPVDGPGIAAALRLTPRPASRPISPVRSASPFAATPTPAQAPAANQATPGLSGSGGAGLEDLADFIANNYEGMGKSAIDVLPELRRKGIVATGSGTYGIQGRKATMNPTEIADLLRLKVRPGSSPAVTDLRNNAAAAPQTFSRVSDSTGRHRVQSPETAEEGLHWLAAWISTNYMGMGKSAADAFPELRRKGVTCTSVRGGQRMFSMAGQPTELAPEEIANILKLRAR